jgi:hypothetical protein
VFFRPVDLNFCGSGRRFGPPCGCGARRLGAAAPPPPAQRSECCSSCSHAVGAASPLVAEKNTLIIGPERLLWARRVDSFPKPCWHGPAFGSGEPG